MRRLLLTTLAVVALFLLGNPAVAQTWSTQAGDFTVHFWKEMFQGGGPGQPGNTLMATGEGFIFKQATLESVTYDPGTGRYITTYVDGSLVLNSQGPWLDRGTLRAGGITATNSSMLDPGTGVLDFVLTFSGEFENQPGLHFQVEATYNGIPEYGYGPSGIPDFHRGFDYNVTITFSGE